MRTHRTRDAAVALWFDRAAEPNRGTVGNAHMHLTCTCTCTLAISFRWSTCECSCESRHSIVRIPYMQNQQTRILTERAPVALEYRHRGTTRQGTVLGADSVGEW